MADSFSRELTDSKVRSASPTDTAYKLTDGGGMFLLVNPNGSKLWRYKFRLNGSEGLDALGTYPEVSLSDARDKHRDSRALVARGVNPVHHRKAERERLERERAAATAGEFEVAVEDWLQSLQHKLMPTTLEQRRRDVNKWLLPAFRGRTLATIKRPEIVAVLKRVSAKRPHKGPGGHGFRGGPEVARNLRTYLAELYERAADTGLVDSNPVPPGRVITKPDAEHHQALAVDRMGEFLVRLQDEPSVGPVARAAIMLTIYGVARKMEALTARPRHFNLADPANLDDTDGASWNLPREVMKGKKRAKREHWVPLPRQALAMLRELAEHATSQHYLFPNERDEKRHMAAGTPNSVLRRLGYDGEATVHGFRAVFSTRYNAKAAKGECSSDAVERCLAHKPKDATRAAYNRFDYAPQRRTMLQDWADWLDGLVAAERARLAVLAA